MLLSDHSNHPSGFNWQSPSLEFSSNRGWNGQSWLKEMERSSTLYPPVQQRKRGGVKRRRDIVDQVDIALKKLKFTPSSETTSTDPVSTPKNPELSTCTALVPVTGRRSVWNRSQWETKRVNPRQSLPNSFASKTLNGSNKSNLENIHNFSNHINNLRNLHNHRNNIGIPSYFSHQPQPPFSPQNETALVLYRPPGRPNSYVEEPDEEETQPIKNQNQLISPPIENSKLLYSSDRCKVELIEDEEDIPMS